MRYVAIWFKAGVRRAVIDRALQVFCKCREVKPRGTVAAAYTCRQPCMLHCRRLSAAATVNEVVRPDS